MRVCSVILALSWLGLWWTPDQQGQREFHRGNFSRAAEAFMDPLWQGTAWYRAGEFEKAVNAFKRSNTPEARFNEGNAWMMLGKYETAVTSYETALAARPDWKDARENRDLAAARARQLKNTGGDMGDQKLGADRIVFDRNRKQQDGQETQIAGGQAMTDAQVQAIWLRQVQTNPADFLKAKFAWQDAQSSGGEGQ